MRSPSAEQKDRSSQSQQLFHILTVKTEFFRNGHRNLIFLNILFIIISDFVLVLTVQAELLFIHTNGRGGLSVTLKNCGALDYYLYAWDKVKRGGVHMGISYRYSIRKGETLENRFQTRLFWNGLNGWTLAAHG
jgi:hypothetical protein